MAAPVSKIVVADIFNGISQNWRNILLAPEAKQEFVNILGILAAEKEEITPPISLMFNFARFTPLDDIKVVILGQDPYPTKGHAQGMCFSSNSDKLPASLHKISKALDNSGFGKLTSADLTHWATQGVLLLNTAFTTIVGKPNEHQDIWAKYTSIILGLIGKHKYNTQKRATCLWGTFAKAYADKFLPEYGWINLTYTHPVARDPFNFKKCDHFLKIKEMGIDIQWVAGYKPPVDSPSYGEDYKYHWFSDGAAKNNQSKDCKAYWGFVSTKPDKTIYSGKVPPVEIEGALIRPTNIRAEGTAILEILKLIKSKNIEGDHLVHTDSEFWINTLDKWLPNRFLKKSYKITDNPNSDIAEPLWDLLNELRKDKKITLRFVRAFHDYNPDIKVDPANGYSPYFWAGNKAAEEAAESSIP